ncbi:hypothetical protein [Leucobacter sp. NPDC077196]|uniref:hypothetical protein n=1 Tax=Leucobacter sp. NPDC077196 TaxID=3154959 RepID=UPI00342E1D54
MTNRDENQRPLDHLPPKEERTDGDPSEADKPSYPTSGDAPSGPTHASPDTAAEPEEPNRHGIDKLPPTGA